MELEFDALEVADEVFVCVAEPPPRFAFVAPIWFDRAVESASWFVTAVCSIDWLWPPPSPDPPTWVWSAFWVVELEFEALDAADDPFVWVAEPPLESVGALLPVGVGPITFHPHPGTLATQLGTSSQKTRTQLQPGPGFPTLTDTFVFVAPFWFEVAEEFALWFVGAL